MYVGGILYVLCLYVFSAPGDESTLSEPIPELSAQEEYTEERSWKTCNVGGMERKIDMKVIEPYKKVLSHGGYFGEARHAIIVFSACYLPDRGRKDYDYVMDNLFLYVFLLSRAFVSLPNFILGLWHVLEFLVVMVL